MKWVLILSPIYVAVVVSTSLFHDLFLPRLSVIIIAMVITYFLAGSFFKPIEKVTSSIKNLEANDCDLTQRLEIKSNSNFGELAQSINNVLNKFQRVFKGLVENAGANKASSSSFSEFTDGISAGADMMNEISNNVAAAAEEMSANMSSVAASMEQSTSNIDLIAAATEEMTATISQIAGNTENAREIASQAVGKTKNASDNIDSLGKAAQEIDQVTEAITEISEQTNLLALNATIEAARAGEAGKGFAVVANEIKELAKETSKATQEIKAKINGIQESTNLAVDVIAQITTIVGDVNEVVSTIASAVEEQSTSTQEIANNVAQASLGIQEVNKNVAQSSAVSSKIAEEINSVGFAAEELSGASSEINQGIEVLEKQTEQIVKLVAPFKI